MSELVGGEYPADGRVDGRVAPADGRVPVVGRVDGCVDGREPVDGRASGEGLVRSPVDGRLRSAADGVSVFDQPPLSRRSQLPLSLRRYTLPLLSV